MNNDGNCSGSLKLIATAGKPTWNGAWPGECPECGVRVELGYAGLVPVHEPPRTGGRPDARLRQVRVRAADVVHDTTAVALRGQWRPVAQALVQAAGVAAAGAHPPLASRSPEERVLTSQSERSIGVE